MARKQGKKLLDVAVQLVVRDGLRCKMCGQFGTLNPKSRRRLIVDHIDNNPTNNSISNLQLLCRKHNYLKNPRLAERRETTITTTVPQTDEMEKSKICEPQFRTWIMERMRKEQHVTKDDAVNAGAEFAACSPVTVVRYLSKLTSSVGPFYIRYDDDMDETFIEWRDANFPKPGEEQKL